MNETTLYSTDIFLDDSNLLTLNSSNAKFLLIGLPQQLAKINTSSLITTHCARNLSFIFDEHPTFSDQISALSKSCYYHILELRYIRPYHVLRTASTIAPSKLDYCNSLYYNLPQSQIKRLQNTENSLACAVTRGGYSGHFVLISHAHKTLPAPSQTASTSKQSPATAPSARSLEIV